MKKIIFLFFSLFCLGTITAREGCINSGLYDMNGMSPYISASREVCLFYAPKESKWVSQGESMHLSCSVSVSASVTANVTCNGGNNGNATATASGGTAPYTYSWVNSASTVVSTSNPTGAVLTGGSYTVTVTDHVGCSNTASVTITQPAMMRDSVSSSVSPGCYGGTSGQLGLGAKGGTYPWSYLWSTGSTLATATGLSAGTYSVVVTDSRGCTNTVSGIVLTQPAEIRDSVASITYPVCNGGKAVVNIGLIGGTSPYTFVWSNGATRTTGTITSLTAGSYTVNVRDKYNCANTAVTVSITQPYAIRDSIVSHTNVACNGASTGSATVGVKYGTTPYTYSWSPNVGSTATVTGLSAGTYSINITDINGCTSTSTKTVSITQPAATFTVSLGSSTNILCRGASTGSATLSVSGTTTPFTYSWSPGGQTTITATGLSAGTYTVTVTNHTGCSQTIGVTLTQPPVVSVSANVTANVSCNGGSNGSVSSTPSGGTSPYTYSWSGGGTNSTKTGLIAGTYTITVTDNCGATATASTTVTQPAVLTASATVSTNVSCPGGHTGSIVANPSNGTSPYTYLWSAGSQTNQTATGLSIGTYTVTVTDYCGSTATASATVIQLPNIRDSVVYTTKACDGNTDGTALVGVKYGYTPYTYLWSAGSQTNATATGLAEGTYTVTVTDNSGCTCTASGYVKPCKVARYNYAIHYSYDIEGNVSSIVTENRDEKCVKQQFKRTDYYYDLVSGKVNEVVYEHDSTDQFMQAYEYDADNRITDVLTSHDSLYWEHDAGYEYYEHGPLAREVIGQRQVQGVDYAYTLNGWIKAVNSGVLYPSDDMGGDGDVHGSNNLIARDAYGYNLNYFNGDYRPIGTSHANVSGLGTTSLYNGNIAGATYSISKLNPKTIGYTYGYDQLNRLTKMQAYAGIDTASLQWATGDTISSFKEKASYDENGNILTYIRHGNTIAGMPLAMDSLNYNYNKGTNQLAQVKDAVGAGNYSTDIDNETSKRNYRYNLKGELAKDSAGGLDTIIWTIYGKVHKIIKPSSAVPGKYDSIVFRYDPLGNRIEKRTYTNVYCHLCEALPNIDTTLYQRDAQGNILAIYTEKNDSVKLSEWDIYGSKRLGSVDTNLVVHPYSAPAVGNVTLDSVTIGYLEGQKQYELDNHLGNVLVTVSDKKTAIDTNSDGVADYYLPVVVNAQDYYPFGMVEPGRSYAILGDSSYRFAFNGKLHDDDIYGKDNAYDYGMRMYDPRLGRFMSVDPLLKKYPYYSSYQFAGNTPIQAVDIDGKEPGAAYDKSFAIINPMDMQGYNIPQEGSMDDKSYEITAVDVEKVGSTISNIGLGAMGIGIGISIATYGTGSEVGGIIFAAGDITTDVGAGIEGGAQFAQGKKAEGFTTIAFAFTGGLAMKEVSKGLKLTKGSFEEHLVNAILSANTTLVEKIADHAITKTDNTKANKPGNVTGGTTDPAKGSTRLDKGASMGHLAAPSNDKKGSNAKKSSRSKGGKSKSQPKQEGSHQNVRNL